MIAGHLQIKNDNYYMVLNYTDANGKRRQPWIPTGLPAKGNKRRAEKLLLDTRKSFVPPVVSKENEDISSDMLFADYWSCGWRLSAARWKRPPFPLTRRW